VIIYSIHKYAIRNVATHLRDLHSGTKKQRQAIINAFSTCILRDPKDIESSLPLGLPLRILGKPLLTFICKEPECEQISISRDEMCKHCNRTHDWRSTKEEREHWHSVWVQTSFKSAGLQKYFTVDYTDQEQDKYGEDEEEANTGENVIGRVESRQTALDETDLSGVFRE
jgi:hypothetical protein